MKAEKKTNRIITGVTGQYYVAAELSKQGYIVCITPSNTPNVDILCSDITGSKQVAIQVKTSRECNNKWQLTKKAEDISAANLFYVFVNLPSDNKLPFYYIVESKKVATFVKKNHRNWLKGTKKNGEPRRNSSIRSYIAKDIKWNNWEALGLGDDL